MKIDVGKGREERQCFNVSFCFLLSESILMGNNLIFHEVDSILPMMVNWYAIYSNFTTIRHTL